MAAGELGGPNYSNAAYCAANPHAIVCQPGGSMSSAPASASVPAPAPAPASPASASPTGSVPVSSAGVPASYSPAAAAGATYVIAGGGGFSLSEVPWWLWAVGAAFGLYLVVK